MKPIREIIVDLQGGDGGKGRDADDAVKRALDRNDGKRVLTAVWQGGDNAGHTVYIPMMDGSLQKFVTHAAPIGIASNVDIAIGPDVAFTPESFLKEVNQAVNLFGYSGRILISGRAGICFDYHRKLDGWQESLRSHKIGTTKSGIGPFYMDNARRDTRITFNDYVSDRFPDKLKSVLNLKKLELTHAGILAPKTLRDSVAPLDVDMQRAISLSSDYLEELIATHEPIRKELRQFNELLEYRMQEYLHNGNHIIAEGRQGKILHPSQGTIPDTTSSYLSGPDGLASLCLPRREFTIVGIEKVYPTRVGTGIIVTDTNDLVGIAELAGEKGATTGRVRRAGYPDWVNIKHACMLNDVDEIHMTRSDCVQDVELKVCTEYDVDGERTAEFPIRLDDVKPIYQDKTYQWRLWEGERNLADAARVHEALKETRKRYVEGGFESLPKPLQEFVLDHDKFVGVTTKAIYMGGGRGDVVYR